MSKDLSIRADIFNLFVLVAWKERQAPLRVCAQMDCAGTSTANGGRMLWAALVPMGCSGVVLVPAGRSEWR